MTILKQMENDYICKKCNEFYENVTDNFDCKKCKSKLSKIPNCLKCESKIQYPLDYEIDTQLCDFCSLALCEKCSKKLNYGFLRCTECGISFCFKMSSKTESPKICTLVPIGEYGSYEECDCYKQIREDSKINII